MKIPPCIGHEFEAEEYKTTTMETIKLGSKGEAVRLWQYFLLGQGYEIGFADGVFGKNTHNATVDFQTKSNLFADGVVGKNTYNVADKLNFGEETPRDVNWPPIPNHLQPLIGNKAKEAVYGKFEFKQDPKNKSLIIVTDNWVKENLTLVTIPQLKKVNGNDKIYFHKKGAEQLKSLWAGWEKDNLLHLVKTYAGSYNPRLIRGSASSLSTHAWGVAFDINVAQNALGKVPALVGEYGEVRSLVPLANELGFFWGGHFKNRPDGMHFEIAEFL